MIHGVALLHVDGHIDLLVKLLPLLTRIVLLLQCACEGVINLLHSILLLVSVVGGLVKALIVLLFLDDFKHFVSSAEVDDILMRSSRAHAIRYLR